MMLMDAERNEMCEKRRKNRRMADFELLATKYCVGRRTRGI